MARADGQCGCERRQLPTVDLLEWTTFNTKDAKWATGRQERQGQSQKTEGGQADSHPKERNRLSNRTRVRRAARVIPLAGLACAVDGRVSATTISRRPNQGVPACSPSFSFALEHYGPLSKSSSPRRHRPLCRRTADRTSASALDVGSVELHSSSKLPPAISATTDARVGCLARQTTRSVDR